MSEPTAFRDRSLTISRVLDRVYLDLESSEEAIEVYDWLCALVEDAAERNVADQ